MMSEEEMKQWIESRYGPIHTEIRLMTLHVVWVPVRGGNAFGIADSPGEAIERLLADLKGPEPIK